MHRLAFVLAALFLLACNSPHESAVYGQLQEHKVPSYAVASAHPLATQAGIDTLKQGGNAFDAAVAVTASLAVVEPYASGLGGGGFWLLHIADGDRDIMLDGREMAPLAVTRDMYLDIDGMPTRQSVRGPLAAGIPGVPAGIVHLSENYGRLPLSATLNSAIQLARNGFAVSERYHKLVSARMDTLQDSTSASEIFLAKGAAPESGFVLRQPQLAKVIEHIRDFGAAGFYQGEVAEKLVNGVQQEGGIWQLKDLQRYQVKERQPITGRYKNLSIVSAAPPSSGGIVLMQMLNMLSMVEVSKMDVMQRTHVIVETMRRAYHDRAQYLGDTDYVEVPVEQLLSTQHAQELFADFNPQRASASRDYLNAATLLDDKEFQEGQNTTHFSIIDQAGNYVAATLSINYPFGSGFVPAGTGVLLNNEMDDFAVKPGHPNLWGLVGSEANAIEAGKRMLSSMSPTFLRDGNRIAVLGTPGGSRIITMVLLSALEFANGADAATMVAVPRFHHQFLPDQIQFESNAFDAVNQSLLSNLGHELKDMQRSYGNMHTIIWDQHTNRVTAASDPRGIGYAQVGE